MTECGIISKIHCTSTDKLNNIATIDTINAQVDLLLLLFILTFLKNLEFHYSREKYSLNRSA